MTAGGKPSTFELKHWPIVLAGLATFGLVAAGTFSPDRRLWGVNHLAFYPVWVRFGALAVVAVSFIPSLQGLISRGIVKAASALDLRPGRRGWFAAFAGGLAVAAFIGLHSSTLLLGDGRLVANSLGAAGGGGQAVGSDFGKIMAGESFARGALLLHSFAERVAVSAFGATPLWGIRVAVAVLGGIMVSVLVWTALSSRASPLARAWLLAIGLGCGAIEIFFGYVENYGLLLVSCALYLLCGLALVSKKSPAWIWPAILCLAVGIFAHLEALVLLPSALFLAALAGSARAGRPVPRGLGPVLLVVSAAGGPAVGYLTGLRDYLLPLAGAGTYRIFSPAHLADLVNEVLLLVPAGVVILAAVLSTRVSKRAAPDTRDWPGGPDSTWFLVMALVPVLGLMCLLRPDLGMARDWDLFSIAAVPLVGVAFVLLWRTEVALRAASLGPVLVPGLVITVVLTAAWIGVNSNADRSLARFEAILTYDSSRFDYAYAVLAAEYHDRGQVARAAETLERALALGGPPRLGVKLSSYYEDAGRKGDAIRLLRDNLKRDRLSERSRYHLIRLLMSEGAYAELQDLAREGTVLHPDKPFFHYAYGRALLAAGQTHAGLAELRTCLTLNPPEDVARQIRVTLQQSGIAYPAQPSK